MGNSFMQTDQLRKWRKFMRWSRSQMVDKISGYLPDGHYDFDPKTYARWERRETQPRIKHWIAIQKLLLKLERYAPQTVHETYDFILRCEWYVPGDEAFYPDFIREQIQHVLERERIICPYDFIAQLQSERSASK